MAPPGLPEVYQKVGFLPTYHAQDDIRSLVYTWRGKAMDLYKDAVCNELKRLLAKLQQLNVCPDTLKKDLDSVTDRVRILCDMLDLIERQERLAPSKNETRS